LDNIKDLSKITLTELLNASQALEQWRLIRQDCFIKGALPTKHQDFENEKKKFFKKK
jgi:hypothetical protein